jgi:hypothetical protein
VSPLKIKIPSIKYLGRHRCVEEFNSEVIGLKEEIKYSEKNNSHIS